jgi:hypothetical protein
MLFTAHATFGAAIATHIGGPISLPLSFASHHLLDRIPHWSKESRLLKTIDVFFALIFTNYIAQLHPGTSLFIWACAALSCLPELDSTLLKYPRFSENVYLQRFHKWHLSVQKRTNKLTGLVLQLLVVIFSLFLSV